MGGGFFFQGVCTGASAAAANDEAKDTDIKEQHEFTFLGGPPKLDRRIYMCVCGLDCSTNRLELPLAGEQHPTTSHLLRKLQKCCF